MELGTNAARQQIIRDGFARRGLTLTNPNWLAPNEEELNTLGKDGWELAGIVTDPPIVRFYFKRLKD